MTLQEAVKESTISVAMNNRVFIWRGEYIGDHKTRGIIPTKKTLRGESPVLSMSVGYGDGQCSEHTTYPFTLEDFFGQDWNWKELES